MSYYNTTGQSGNALKTAHKQTKTQDAQVLSFFNNSSNVKHISASMIWSRMNCPITSIRRSLHTLEADGLIKKTGKQVMGTYGRPENTYEKI